MINIEFGVRKCSFEKDMIWGISWLCFRRVPWTLGCRHPLPLWSCYRCTGRCRFFGNPRCPFSRRFLTFCSVATTDVSKMFDDSHSHPPGWLIRHLIRCFTFLRFKNTQKNFSSIFKTKTNKNKVFHCYFSFLFTFQNKKVQFVWIEKT